MAERETVRLAACECGQLTLNVTGPLVHVYARRLHQMSAIIGFRVHHVRRFAETGVTISGTFTTFDDTGTEGPTLMASFCPTYGSGKCFRTGAYRMHRHCGRPFLPIRASLHPCIQTAHTGWGCRWGLR